MLKEKTMRRSRNSETIRCPHCECKVSLREVEKEEGLCPECGQPINKALQAWTPSLPSRYFASSQPTIHAMTPSKNRLPNAAATLLASAPSTRERMAAAIQPFQCFHDRGTDLSAILVHDAGRDFHLKSAFGRFHCPSPTESVPRAP